MEKVEMINRLYFEEKKTLTEIAKIINTSVSYISKVLRKDERYKEEKEKRKNDNLKARRDKQKTLIYGNRRNKIDLEYITNESEIREIRISNTDLGSADYDLIPKGEGKKLLAFMQLIVCRNAWWKKYNCAVTGKTPTIYIIKSLKNGNVVIDWVTDFMPVLSFNSQKIRDKFYNTFKDLIEQAKDLI